MNEDQDNIARGVPSPRAGGKKLDPRTLIILLGVFGGLGLLVLLNMN